MTLPHAVLIVGVGSIGERHLRCFQATGRAEVSLVEVNPALRATIAERYSVRAFATLDEALGARSRNDQSNAKPNQQLSAVVATPANLHVDIAIRLAHAGHHLLIEKPLSTNVNDIGKLASVVQERAVVASIAYVYRSFPALIAMRQALLSGRFGKPVQIVATCGQHFPTYRPAYRDIYYKDHATGGGAIQDALTHVLNAGEWLVGPIDRLVADAAHQVLADVNVEDTVHILTRHGDVLGSYSLNQHQAPNESTLTVVCQGGTLRWETHTQRWRWMTKPDEAWHDEPFEAQPRDAAFVHQANCFLDAVDGTREPSCPLDEGAQTLRVNLAALASVQSRSWQAVGR